MATSNFKVFDSTGSNMTSDEDYAENSARINGVLSGPASSMLYNKAQYQASIMAAALAQFIVNQGIDASDEDLNNLVTALTNSLSSPASVLVADRIARALMAQADVGNLSLCPTQSTPAKATYAVGSAGNLLGGYHYREVLITGYKQSNGTYWVNGFAPAAQRSSYDVSPSSQTVSIANIPTGGAGCIGRAIYRSAANGAAGSEKFCGIIWDNTTTVYSDNLPDAQLGLNMPNGSSTPAAIGTAIPTNVPMSNTTGSNLTLKPLSFTNGYENSPGTYDGSAAKSVSVPKVTLHTAAPTTTLGPGELWGVY